MLPILRILPVGGVLLAIFILVLALIPPDGARAPLSPEVVPPRGALLDRDRQLEARQFLIHAALKRADELSRLRDLPDTPTRPAAEEPKVAGLPSDRSESDPDEPVSTNETPVVNIPVEGGANIPVEGGESSPSELPAVAPEKSVPATKTPERAKPAQRETHRRVHRRRPTTNVAQPRPFNLFEALFGGQQYQQPVYGSQQANQRYQQSTYYRYQQPTYYYGNQQYTYGQQTTYGSQQAYGQQTVLRYQSPTNQPAVPGTNAY
jgi:hypothetical protein